MVSGWYYKDCNYWYDLRLQLMKVDQDGNIQWRKFYGDSLGVALDILYTSDSTFVQSIDDEVNMKRGVGKFDKNGNIINVIYITDGRAPAFYTNINSDEAIGLSTETVYDPIRGSYVIAWGISRINLAQNQIVWKKIFRPAISCNNTTHGFYGVHASIKLKGNYFYIGAGVNNEKYPVTSLVNGWDGLIMKFNLDGDSIWGRYYQIDTLLYDTNANYYYSESSQFFDFDFTADGGIMAVGCASNVTDGYPSWIVKMDSNGYAPGAQTVSVEEFQGKQNSKYQNLKIYPNPSYLFTNVEFNQNLDSDAYLTIYNLNGQQVYSTVAKKGIKVLRLDIADLKEGTYILKLTDSQGAFIGSGKILVK